MKFQELSKRLLTESLRFQRLSKLKESLRKSLRIFKSLQLKSQFITLLLNTKKLLFTEIGSSQLKKLLKESLKFQPMLKRLSKKSLKSLKSLKLKKSSKKLLKSQKLKLLIKTKSLSTKSSRKFKLLEKKLSLLITTSKKLLKFLKLSKKLFKSLMKSLKS